MNDLSGRGGSEGGPACGDAAPMMLRNQLRGLRITLEFVANPADLNVDAAIERGICSTNTLSVERRSRRATSSRQPTKHSRGRVSLRFGAAAFSTVRRTTANNSSAPISSLTTRSVGWANVSAETHTNCNSL